MEGVMMENMLANIISTYKTIVVAFAFVAAICFMINLSKDISHGIQKKKFLKKYGLYTAFMWFCLVMIRIANMLSDGQTLNTSTIVRDVILLIFCAFMIWNVSNWMPSTNESTSGDTVSDEKSKAADVIPVEETDTQYAPVEVAPAENAETKNTVEKSVDNDNDSFLIG